MVRTKGRSHKIRSIVLVAACSMVASVIVAGWPVLFSQGTGKILAVASPFSGLPAHDATAEDEPDSHGPSSTAGMTALWESFAPVIHPPQGRGTISPVSVHIHCSAHIPRIFHPPSV